MTISVEASIMLDHRLMLAHDYAIINGMQVEPEARSDLEGRPVVPARFHEQAYLFPILVNLRKLPETQRIDLIDRATAWHASRGNPYFSALLTSPDAEDVLCRHLIKRSDVRLPDGTHDVLRWHDPRVFRHLSWILRPEQMAALLGNIRHWTWCDPDRSWCRLENPQASPAQRVIGLRLDTDQWPHLMRLPDIHAVLATLQRKAPSLPHDDKLVQRVDAALAVAERQWPSARDVDRQLFAEHTIRFGDRLHHHTQFQARMAPVRMGEQSYFSAFADLDDETLQTWATSSELAKDCS